MAENPIAPVQNLDNNQNRFEEEYLCDKAKHLCSKKACNKQMAVIYIDYPDCKLRLCEEHQIDVQTTHRQLADKYLNLSSRISPAKENVDLLKELETTYSDMIKLWLETVEDRIASVESSRSDYDSFMIKAEQAVRQTIQTIIDELQKLITARSVRIIQALCPELAEYPNKFDRDFKLLLSYRESGKRMQENIKDLVRFILPMKDPESGELVPKNDLLTMKSVVENYHEKFERHLRNSPVLNGTSADDHENLSKYKSSRFWEDKIIHCITNYSSEIMPRPEPPAPVQQNGEIPEQAVPQARTPEDSLKANARFKVVKNLEPGRSKWKELNGLNENPLVGEAGIRPAQRNDNQLVEMDPPADMPRLFDEQQQQQIDAMIDQGILELVERAGKPEFVELLKKLFSLRTLQGLVEKKEISDGDLAEFLQKIALANKDFEAFLKDKEPLKVIVSALANVHEIEYQAEAAELQAEEEIPQKKKKKKQSRNEKRRRNEEENGN